MSSFQIKRPRPCQSRPGHSQGDLPEGLRRLTERAPCGNWTHLAEIKATSAESACNTISDRAVCPLPTLRARRAAPRSRSVPCAQHPCPQPPHASQALLPSRCVPRANNTRTCSPHRRGERHRLPAASPARIPRAYNPIGDVFGALFPLRPRSASRLRPEVNHVVRALATSCGPTRRPQLAPRTTAVRPRASPPSSEEVVRPSTRRRVRWHSRNRRGRLFRSRFCSQ